MTNTDRMAQNLISVVLESASDDARRLELEWLHREAYAMKSSKQMLNVVSNPDNLKIDQLIIESIRELYGDDFPAEAAARAVHEEELLIIDSLPLTAAQVQKPMGNRKQRRAAKKLNRTAKISPKTK